MPITIRRMKIDDLLPVYRLGLECFDTHTIPCHIWTIQEVAFHFEFENDHCFVANDNNELIGFSIGARCYDNLDDTGYIEWTAVRKEYRNKGVGIKLFLKTAKSIASKGANRIIVDTTQSNKEADTMAERFGLQKITTINVWLMDVNKKYI